jgi:hypothetical protein
MIDGCHCVPGKIFAGLVWLICRACRVIPLGSKYQKASLAVKDGSCVVQVCSPQVQIQQLVSTELPIEYTLLGTICDASTLQRAAGWLAGGVTELFWLLA